MEITDEEFSDEFSIFGVSIDSEDVYEKCKYLWNLLVLLDDINFLRLYVKWDIFCMVLQRTADSRMSFALLHK